MNFRFLLAGFCLSSLSLVSSAQVTVLTYHTISDKKNNMATSFITFEKQINYLISKNANFVDTTTLINSIIKKKELPKNTVVITFDDGWKNQVLAMELLDKKHIPATFALVTQFQKINSSTGIQIEDFIRFKKAPFIYVNHSYTHNVKDFLKEPENDLVKSELELNKIKNLAVNVQPYYVYPYGKKNTLLIEAIKRHHYIAAFGVNSVKFSTTNVDIYNIPRFLVNEHTDLSKIIP